VWDRVDDREPGASRALGIVLMRLPTAEINQHPIAHIIAARLEGLAEPGGICVSARGAHIAWEMAYQPVAESVLDVLQFQLRPRVATRPVKTSKSRLSSLPLVWPAPTLLHAVPPREPFFMDGKFRP